LSEINNGVVSINNNLFNIPYRTNVFAFNFLASYSILAGYYSARRVLRAYNN